MVDPKKVELTPYTRLPHMLAPVITEPQGACACPELACQGDGEAL